MSAPVMPSIPHGSAYASLFHVKIRNVSRLGSHPGGTVNSEPQKVTSVEAGHANLDSSVWRRLRTLAPEL
jgi:hypothetical protein